MPVTSHIECNRLCFYFKRRFSLNMTNNQIYNHTPYGFKRHGTDLIPCAKEGKVLTKIDAWRKQGKSLRGIARDLNALGIASKRGGQWYASAVRSVMGSL